MKLVTRTSLAALVTATALSGCGHTQPTFVATTPHPDASGKVGSTLPVSDSSGTKLQVAVEQVIDPASGADPYTNAAHGKRFVGIKLRIHNVAPQKYQNNANNETTLTLSNGRRLASDYNPLVGCGNFDNGQVVLNAGQTKTGCVAFQVPNGVHVTKVSYRNTVFPGTGAQWTSR